MLSFGSAFVTHVIKSVSSNTEHRLLQRESQETLKAWSMKKSALRLIKTYAHISIYVISKCKQPRRQHCIASNLEFNKNVSQKKCEKLLSRRCQRNVPLTTLNGHWLGTPVQSNEIQYSCSAVKSTFTMPIMFYRLNFVKGWIQGRAVVLNWNKLYSCT